MQKVKKGRSREIGAEDKMLMNDKGKEKHIGSYFAFICLNKNNIHSRIDYIKGQQTMT